MLVDLATAKSELRVTDGAQDADIERKLAAAEEQVQAFLGRNVYRDQDALTSALTSVATVLSSATTSLQAALDATSSLDVQAERDAQERYAKDTYNEAFAAWQRTVRGMVVNESIRTAILLVTASLWEHRGDEDAVEGIPQAARAFLWPFRAGVGV